MEKSSSLVLVDKRPYRKIAQENWGLTNQQMKGMHVHHRIPRSRGGTNDPSNLYVCSPWFHQNVWHNGEEFIAWAIEGGIRSAEAFAERRKTDPKWALEERARLRKAAKLSHSKYKGTDAYRENQRMKSLRTHPVKRARWTRDIYEKVWQLYLLGFGSGYLMRKEFDDPKWKTYENMLKYAKLGFSFEQLIDANEYVKEVERLRESPISSVLAMYDD